MRTVGLIIKNQPKKEDKEKKNQPKKEDKEKKNQPKKEDKDGEVHE